MSGALAARTHAAITPRWPGFRNGAANVLRTSMQQVIAWWQRRRRVAADRQALANMSDRELMDIGIPRGSLHAVAERAWLREYPC